MQNSSPKKRKATRKKKNVRLLTETEREEVERVNVIWERYKRKTGTTQEQMGKKLGYKFGQSAFGGYLNRDYTPAINERFILDFSKITGCHLAEIRPSMIDHPALKTPDEAEILDLIDAMPAEERRAFIRFLKSRQPPATASDDV